MLVAVYRHGNQAVNQQPGATSATRARTLDIAKRLIDDGFYPPTVYWPQVVEGRLMAEPTETEDKETLDRFAAALHAIAREIETDPALVKGAPHETLVGRIDETRAARQPDLRWRKGSSP